ncbi:MAG TPA: STAS domain-containing protein [Miltoncostaeaceae bacterium]|nr:STAS domain-containing protein [Miltoncostaeaceae bacterium]
MEHLVITQGEKSGAPVLRLEGGLDLLSLRVLEDALAAIPPPTSEVILDMRALEFIDSSGVRCLLQQDTARRERGGSLAFVASPDGTFARTVRLLRLWDRFQIREDDTTPT